MCNVFFITFLEKRGGATILMLSRRGARDSVPGSTGSRYKCGKIMCPEEDSRVTLETKTCVIYVSERKSQCLLEQCIKKN